MHIKVEGYTAGIVGAKYVCDPGDGVNRIFYVLENNTDSSNISLIMDSNIDNNRVAWCAIGDDGCILKDGFVTNYNGPKTADAYLDSKTENKWINSKIISIELPKYDQIYNVNNSRKLTSTPWLYENLYSNYDTSLSSEYWTSTADPESPWNVWSVDLYGSLTNINVANSDFPGVRPVITIAKDSI